MFELLETAFSGVNIIPTTLLGLVLLYWLTVIIGIIDFNFIEIDLDTSGTELDIGPFHGILAFLNVANLPFMLVFSIFTLNFWTLSMLTHLLPFKSGGPVSLILFIPELFISLFLTKIITIPLKNIFKFDYNEKGRENEVTGKLCRLMGDLMPGRLGQAEVERDSGSLIINVKIVEGDGLQKGSKALVIKKDEEKDFYVIKKFEGVG